MEGHATGGVARRPGLLQVVRERIRARHYSLRTEQAYVRWIWRFVLFHGRRHPRELGAAEVEAFLSHLAVAGRVAAGTQNQALAALLFLYREVLGQALPWLDNVVRAKRPVRVPTVLARDEVQALLRHLDGTPWLLASLLYGTGLRLMEGLRLRVKDVDFARNEITVRAGKGAKDRRTVLPASLVEPLQRQIERALAWHRADLDAGFGAVWLPHALARKFPGAPREPGWQYVFPASRRSRDPRDGVERRHHLDDAVFSRPATGATGRGAGEAGDGAHAAAFVRDPSAGGRVRHPHGAGAARARGCVDDADLHARVEPRCAGGAQSAGWGGGLAEPD